ncbi:hypothetical protein OSB04_029487 [Centaurea solstitialis]|uniref:Reverse transcriptase Ty1/copia-type domain-containing protein n=1 Tax=Centaurea solstitialis TaxID=347529 RepID=A0AA38SUK3_9ASTR|nr:hypothetical protein OSB04_029487 [Centaurea solstitialis]
MTAIEKNHTWELVDLPAAVIPIAVKWLFKTKLNELGKVDKYKAGLVVKGYANGKEWIITSLYVDDLIYAGNDPVMCESYKRSMQLEFERTDLGKMKFFLGVEVSQNSEGISLCQSQYANEVLRRFEMWEANDVKNPILPGTNLMKLTSGKDVNNTKYMSLIGSLMYLTVTRPDLMYVVSLLSRLMGKPNEEHMAVAKRVLRYIKGTLNHGLCYKKDKSQKLRVFTDSNYAPDLEDRRSTSGYVCLFNGTAICWSSRKQEVVTLSTT